MVNDFIYQKNYILSQAQRLLGMQDKLPLSPSRGCFQYAYWRDRASDFPDSRFQEAGAALGLIAHPLFFDSSLGVNKELLLESLYLGLLNLKQTQHLDGSYDESYKHEHGFSVTASTTIAYGLAFYFMGEKLSNECWKLYRHVMLPACQWLMENRDGAISDQEVAGAAALALVGKNLNEQQFIKGAKKKYELSLSHSDVEKWFIQVAQRDLGYCSVILDNNMLYHLITGDERVLVSMEKLVNFLFPLLHPNATISQEVGGGPNPYVSHLGFLLMSKHNSKARAIVKTLSKSSPQYEGILPYLSDDMRLCRGSILAAASFIVFKELESQISNWVEQDIFTHQIPGSYYSATTKILVHKGENFQLVFSPEIGGVIRAFSACGQFSLEDNSYLLDDRGVSVGTISSTSDRQISALGPSSYEALLPFYPAKFYQPSLRFKLMRRLLGRIPGLSIRLKRMLKFYYKFKKTVSAKSLSPVKSVTPQYLLKRRIDCLDDKVRIQDNLIAVKQGTYSLAHVEEFVFIDGVRKRIDRDEALALKEWILIKEFYLKKDGWHLNVTQGGF